MKNKYTTPLILSVIAILIEMAFLYSAIFSKSEIMIALAAFSLVVVCLIHGYSLRCWEMQREFNKTYKQFVEMIEVSKSLFERESEDEQGKE